MGVDVNFKWNRPINQIAEDTTGGKKTLLSMANTWHKLYDPFTPMETGNMAHNAIDIYIENAVGIIHHKAPYAERLYEGNGFHFSHEKHNLATHHWDEAAKHAGKAKILIENVQAFIKKGG